MTERYFNAIIKMVDGSFFKKTFNIDVLIFLIQYEKRWNKKVIIELEEII